MKRTLYKDLLLWKNSRNRKPLLLQGARQVGKTYLVNKFGNSEYSEFISLNFEQDPDLKTLFQGELDTQSLISNISLYRGKKVIPENTLIFFDEIQVAPEVLTSLKYFNEQAPEFHVIAAGSLLGVSLGKEVSFPVGQVNFMTMYPMNFIEYLIAFDNELIAEKLISTKQVDSLPEIIHNKLLDQLKIYLFLGGMPEILQDYLDHADISSARKIQNEILEAYKRDFSKYTDGSQAIKTSELWHSIPHQLAKENKKFKYRDVNKKARASTFEQTFEWLKKAGLIHIAYHLNTPKIPLSGYVDHSRFKVYMLDCGLLGAMLNITSDLIIKPTELFREYNGAFIENFIAAEFVTSGIRDLFYWTSKSKAEVDFIVQSGNEIFPVEVKSGTSRNLKSLRSYAGKYNPNYVIRISPRNFIMQNDFINLPLYASFLTANLSEIINDNG